MSNPLITLKSKPEIDGTVHANKGFVELSGMAKLDLLRDWIFMLEQLYLLERQAEFGGEFKMHKLAGEDTYIQGKPLLPPPTKGE